MGLDQYAYATTQVPDRPVDFEVSDADALIATWRKHPDLHGWMERLYRERGGTGVETGFGDGQFNTVPVALTLEDLDALEAAVRSRTLPHTEGFFFGASLPEDAEDDLAFIGRARKALSEGKCVYYTSWW